MLGHIAVASEVKGADRRPVTRVGATPQAIPE